MREPLSTLVVAVLLVSSTFAGVGGAATAASPGGSPAGHVGVPTSNIDVPDQAQATGLSTLPTLPAGVPTDAQAWHVSTSDHAADLAAQIDYTSEGLVVTLTDDVNHDGREVAMNASAIAAATGDRPGVAYGRHESGERWTSDVEYRNGRAIFTVPKFSTNTISFSGTVQLAGTYSDGAQSTYNLSDKDAVDNFHINATGVINAQWDNETRTSVGPSSTTSTAPAGNLDPTGPSVNGNPTVDVTNPGVRIKGSVTDATNIPGPMDVAVDGGYAYIVSDGRLTVVDVSTPSSPSVVTSLADSVAFNSSKRLAIDKTDNLLIATSLTNDQVSVVDVSTPSSPTVAGSVSGTSLNGAYGVALNATADEAYVTGLKYDGVAVVDYSTPSTPSVAGSVSDSTVMDRAQEIAVTGGTAVVAGKNSDSVATVDVSTPSTPSVLGSVSDATILNGARGMAVTSSGSYAAAGMGAGDGVALIDISAPSTPTIAGSVSSSTTLDGVTSMVVNGDYAYASATTGDAVTAVNISDPTAPTVVSSKTSTSLDSTRGITVAGSNTYSAPANTNKLVALNAPGKVTSLSVTENGMSNSASFGFVEVGTTETAELVVDKSATSLSWSGSGHVIDYTLNMQEQTQTEDIQIDVNAGSTSYSGTLAQGSTTALSTNTSWVQEGTNKVNVTVDSDNSLSADAPTPQVDLDYHHGATSNLTVDVGSYHWRESYNASKTFESSRQNAEMSVTFLDNVVHISMLEKRVNGNSWQTVSSSNYALDGQTLTVSLGSVSAGDTVEVRVNGRKVQAVNGDITVKQPSALSEDLDTKVKFSSLTDNFHIEVANTSSYVHYLTNPSWTDDDAAFSRIDASGTQDLHVPTALNGSTARVRTEPVEVSPSSGTVDVEIVDAASNEFTISGSSSSVDVEVGWFDTTTGETYALQTTSGETIGTKTAQSPVWFLTDGSTETYLIQLADGSSGGGDTMSSDGPVVVGGGNSPLSDALLLVVVAVLMFATVFVGRRYLGLDGKMLTAMLGIGGAVLGVLAIEAIADVSLVATALQLATSGAGSGLTIVLALAILLGLFVVDEGTGLTIPTWLWVIAVAAVGVWVLDTISNGGLTSGLDQVSPLVWLLVIGGTIIIARNALKPDRTILQLRGEKK